MEELVIAVAAAPHLETTDGRWHHTPTCSNDVIRKIARRRLNHLDVTQNLINQSEDWITPEDDISTEENFRTHALKCLDTILNNELTVCDILNTEWVKKPLWVSRGVTWGDDPDDIYMAVLFIGEIGLFEEPVTNSELARFDNYKKRIDEIGTKFRDAVAHALFDAEDPDEGYSQQLLDEIETDLNLAEQALTSKSDLPGRREDKDDEDPYGGDHIRELFPMIDTIAKSSEDSPLRKALLDEIHTARDCLPRIVDDSPDDENDQPDPPQRRGPEPSA